MRFPDTMVVQRGVDLPPRLFTLDSVCDDRIVFTLPPAFPNRPRVSGFTKPCECARPAPVYYGPSFDPRALLFPAGIVMIIWLAYLLFNHGA